MGNYPHSSRTNHTDFSQTLEWQRLRELGVKDRLPVWPRVLVALAGLGLVAIAGMIGMLV